MKTQDELRSELKQISKIYYTAQESYDIVKFLTYNGRNNYFFHHTKIVNWRIAVLELMKLFSTSAQDRYRLNDFIKRLKDVGFSIPSTCFDEWEQKILKEESAISNLKDQRNKVYAHTDLNDESIVNSVTLGKAKEILDIAFSVIRDIKNYVLLESQSQEFTGNTPLSDLKKVIADLNTNDKKWEAIEESFGITKPHLP